MKKRIISALLALTVVLGTFAGCSSKPSPTPAPSPAPGATTPNSVTYKASKLKLTTNGTDIATCTTVGNDYSKKIAEKTSNAVDIKVFPNDQLAGGNQSKGIEMLAQGTTDMGMYSNGVLGNLDSKIQIANMPFIFDNYDQAAEAFAGKGGEYIAKLLDAKGILFLGSFHNGLRQISNSKRAVVTPADVSGLKIRVPGGEAYVETFKILKADPVAMSWSEVFTALQQGTLDGQENGYATQYSNKIYEVQKYVTEWNYMYDAFNIVANKANFLKLDEATQTLLKEEAKNSSTFGNNYVVEKEKEIKKEYVEKHGIQITELTPEQLGAFKDVVRPVQEMLMTKYGNEACVAFGLK